MPVPFGPPPPVAQSDSFDRWARLLFERVTRLAQFNPGQVNWGAPSATQVFAGPGPAFRTLVDADIPSAIARDTEVTAAIGAHESAQDPHPQYAYGPGFENRTDSTISFDNATRTLTVAPVSASFTFWANRTKYVKSAAQTKQIADTEGLWFFYFDSAGALQATQAPGDDFILTHAATAIVYWDADNNLAILIADERHGHTMDPATHLYSHNTRKAVIDAAGGLALGDIVADGSGDLATHAQFSVAGGTIWDEDLKHSIGALAAPANVPIFYRSGAAGSWRRKTADDYPLIYANPGTRASYNQFTGGAWQLTEAGNLKFVLVHYFAIGANAEPRVIGVCGQAEYATATEARAGAEIELASLVLTGLPVLEFVAIATVIFQTSTGYANTPKSRIRTTDTGDSYIDWRASLIPLGGTGAATSVTVWGTITGTLSDQTDLQTALNAAGGGVTGAIPFTLADSSETAIALTVDAKVPFFIADGSQHNIGLVSDGAYNSPVLDLSVLPAVDQTALGPRMSVLPAGAPIAIMDLVTLDASGQWVPADASTVATFSSAIGVALKTVAAGASVPVSLAGSLVRNDAWAWVPANPLYVSETAGQMTAAQPVATDAAIRVVGFAVTADVILLQPSQDYLTHI